MTKKKHQNDPTSPDSTSESGDENQNSSECSHINKALDFARVRRVISKTGLLLDCQECKKQDPLDMPDIEWDRSLWLCLSCGNQAGGRANCKHALEHSNKSHSDSHAICVNTTTWIIWCYDCDNEVNVTCKKKLLETVEFLKKQRSLLKDSKQIVDYSTKLNETRYQPPNCVKSTGALPKTISVNSSELPRARGLTNLGNTCFFNSVMQCLGQTPYLVQLLDETAKSHHFQLPGGQLKLKDKDEVMSLPPLEGDTETWGQLAQTLTETLHELQSGRSEVYNPRHLFGWLTRRMPQFGGGDQHDSHELLRHLLEAVREEDQRRFKAVILEKLGFNKKTDPNTVEEEQKQVVRFYGQQVSEMLLATEQVFRGALVSILQCQVCYHLSHREEKFLDLSLPISEKQVAPVLRRKAEDNEDSKPSKYQVKKEKRAERKKKKQKHNKNNNLLLCNNVENADVSMENKSDSEESDADVEDNVEEQVCNNSVIPLPPPGEDFSNKGSESGYNSDKVDNSSPDSNRINSPGDVNVDDSGVPSPTAPPNILNSLHNSPASSETNVDMGSPLQESTSPDDEYQIQNGTYPRAVSRLAFVDRNVDLKDVNLEKLSLLNDGDSKKVNDMFEEGACAMDPTTELMEEDEDYGDTSGNTFEGTLAPRYQCEESECSVESCLNQFTECELMMGSNKVGCDSCTKRSGSKKTVYTDTSKQLLIYNPPAVLILHLKRFQVCRFRSAKVSKFVKFSMQLDLGPFCSKRSQNLPTVQQGQTKVLYSLYGVVEHSGSIHGGHYVAYIKVRPPLDENSPRWQFIPKNQRDKIKGLELGADGEPNPPQGKWYYISDSYVTDVSESKVLSAQAYLLFYERLL